MRPGRIKVISGPMFSGKTTRLLDELRERRASGGRCVLARPGMDTRAPEGAVSSHDGSSEPAVVVMDAAVELYRHAVTDGGERSLADAVFIDEAQFMDSGLPYIVRMIAAKGVDVFLACLDKDYKGNPFSVSGSLMCVADEVEKLNGRRCGVCGSSDDVRYSMRTVPGDSVVMVGGEDKYVPSCVSCWIARTGGR